MEGALLEIIGGLLVILIGWLHLRMNTLHKKIEELDKNKVDHDDMTDLKADIKFIRDSVLEIKVEQARWQGRAEKQEQMQRERS